MQTLALRNTAKKPLVPNVPIIQPLCSFKTFNMDMGILYQAGQRAVMDGDDQIGSLEDRLLAQAEISRYESAFGVQTLIGTRPARRRAAAGNFQPAHAAFVSAPNDVADLEAALE
jgi:hypothetical protein